MKQERKLVTKRFLPSYSLIEGDSGVIVYAVVRVLSSKQASLIASASSSSYSLSEGVSGVLTPDKSAFSFSVYISPLKGNTFVPVSTRTQPFSSATWER